MICQFACSGYVPPEYIDAAIISIKFDIYSLGVVIIKLMTGPMGYFRSAEMSPEQFIELVHANWKKRLQTTSIYTLQQHSEQVKRCIEIALSCVDADRHKRPSIGAIINMLNETEGNKPGSVQMVIKNNKMAPLLEHKKKVMLQLACSDYTGDWPGLDLVAVLDISFGMFSPKMEKVQTALRFIMRKLSPIDRISIITFSGFVRELCSLRQMTAASQLDLDELIESLGDTHVHVYSESNIENALLVGVKVLAERKVSSGRVVAIMLMSASPSSWVGECSWTNVPVYTFGYGTNVSPRVLNSIAIASIGGMFSHVQDTDSGDLTIAFSQCLAGLLTISVQDLELMVAAVGGGSVIVNVTAGSYRRKHDASGLVTISFGDLYRREVRNVIVELHLPATVSERDADILKVSYSYTSSSSAGSLQFVAPPETLTVWRANMDELPLPMELHMEEVRLLMARTMMWPVVEDELKSQNMLKAIQSMLEDVELGDPLLRIEMLELMELCKTEETCMEHCRAYAYAYSSESSHYRQRFTMRGRNMEMLRLFATPRMDMYLEQAKKFHDDPTTPLPSADDDLEEEIGAHPIHVASREEEIKRLSLDVEDPTTMDAEDPTIPLSSHSREASSRRNANFFNMFTRRPFFR
ncbi:hypothetical protein VPH35_033722 [Triticum aestivum]|uniref:VWFA domain-containing protein n=1 Tax=Aegilops tauschii subsp. strangulata TaxID=200361 RepID=A0A453A8Y4_AEGTS|nr:uncharacterized protein LOC123051030 isoform X1 [Triticum aestivum]XP_044329703.1 uncharacterized protein LOC123051030 isoform X1 [Triticum aestivum]